MISSCKIFNHLGDIKIFKEWDRLLTGRNWCRISSINNIMIYCGLCGRIVCLRANPSPLDWMFSNSEMGPKYHLLDDHPFVRLQRCHESLCSCERMATDVDFAEPDHTSTTSGNLQQMGCSWIFFCV